MSTLFVQDLGNSKGMIVDIIRQGTHDVVLRCIKDDFTFAVSKSNFKKFYRDYDNHKDYKFNPSDEELDGGGLSDLTKLK